VSEGTQLIGPNKSPLLLDAPSGAFCEASVAAETPIADEARFLAGEALFRSFAIRATFETPFSYPATSVIS
jgi:hypothetical protein